MKALVVFSLLLLAGCQSNTTKFYLEYNNKTGIANGWVKQDGKVTKIRMEPEQMEIIK